MRWWRRPSTSRARVVYPAAGDTWVTAQGHEVAPSKEYVDVQRHGVLTARVEYDPERSDREVVEAVAAAAAPEIDNVALRAELARQVEVVTESRARLATAHLDERRRIERDLHDGAQQRLLAIALQLQAARVNGEPEVLTREVDRAVVDLGETVRELRDLAAGLQPAALAGGGLLAAVVDLTGRIPLRVQYDVVDRRFPARVEAAAWFVIAEGMANVVKHARTDEARISVACQRLAAAGRRHRPRGRRGGRPGARARRSRRPGRRAARDACRCGRSSRRAPRSRRCCRACRDRRRLRAAARGPGPAARRGRRRGVRHGPRRSGADRGGRGAPAGRRGDRHPDASGRSPTRAPRPPYSCGPTIRTSRILLLSQAIETHFASQLFERHGERFGYLLKDRVVDVSMLMHALHTITAGGTVLDPEIARRMMHVHDRSHPVDALSERERDVLGLMAEGRSNGAIADRLVVSLKTVESHIASIFTKLDLHDEPDDHRRVLAVLAALSADASDPTSGAN